MYGLASSAFARHYLRNHGCFLFLWVLRCFTSPRSLQLPYVFRQRSPDITPVSFEVSLFGDPRIEACLPAPRGLSQVTTSFIGSWCLGIHRLPLVACCYYKDARVHCEVLNIRAVTRADDSVMERPASVRVKSASAMPPKLQDPTACLGLISVVTRGSTPCTGCTDEISRSDGLMVNVPHSRACSAPGRLPDKPRLDETRRLIMMLLRKEVIQPHLPVRLPCYDLVLIASPTFDGSLPQGLGHRLRVLPTFMT